MPRKVYLAASSTGAYSAVSLLQKFDPITNEGGSTMVSLIYIASEILIPGYGGRMSSAKAKVESDTRVLAFEAGRKWEIRVNTISARPFNSCAATASGKANEPGEKKFNEKAFDYLKANALLPQSFYNDDVGDAAMLLVTPWNIAGVTLCVDNGLYAMAMAIDGESLKEA